MSIPHTDLNAIRLGRHALRHGAVAASLHALGTESFARLGRATEQLFEAAHAVVSEKADDVPVRAERDAAVADLTESVSNALAAVLGLGGARDRLGRLVDPAALARARTLVDNYLPEGQPSRLSTSPDRLITQARSVAKGLAAFGDTAEMVAGIEAGAERLTRAQGAIARETEELAAAYARLDAARTEQIAARAEARGWAVYAASRWGGIDVERIFPSLDPTRESAATLDGAGVEPAPAMPG